LTAQLAEAMAARKAAEAARDDVQNQLAKQAHEAKRQTAAQAMVDKQLAEGEQQRTALQQQLAQAEQARSKLADQVAVLTKAASDDQAKLAAAETARDAAQTALKAKADAPAEAKVSLVTVAGRDAYASGFMVGESLHQTLAAQADLGVHPDKALLLAGVTDSINERPQLQLAALQAQYDAMVKRLSDKEMARYTAGEKKLAQLGSDSKRLIKRNDTLYFLLNKKGSSKVPAGQRVQVALTETNLDSGKVLRSNQVGNVLNDGKAPYLIDQVIQLGGIGSSLTVYGFAADVYPAQKLPAGMFGYTVLKYDIDVRALVGAGKKKG
jgi:DNA repair exonuclease SbcCD ATPase subunit